MLIGRQAAALCVVLQTLSGCIRRDSVRVTLRVTVHMSILRALEPVDAAVSAKPGKWRSATPVGYLCPGDRIIDMSIRLCVTCMDSAWCPKRGTQYTARSPLPEPIRNLPMARLGAACCRAERSCHGDLVVRAAAALPCRLYPMSWCQG